MADYTEPDLNDFLPGEPLTSAKALLLVENPIAITEGASGAPRIVGEAIARPGAGLPVATVTAADTYKSALEPLGYVQGTTSTTSLTEVVAATFTIVSYTGSLRFVVVQGSPDLGSVKLSLYKNDVLVTSWTTSSLSTSRTSDVSISPDDVIEYRHNRVGNGPSTFALSGVFADDPYVHQPVFIRGSNQ